MQHLFRKTCADGTDGADLQVLWPEMDTDRAIRLQAWCLIKLGLNQKMLAQRMGMSPSAFSRWLNLEKKKPASLRALDGMRQFLSDLKAEATRDVTTLGPEELKRLEAELGVAKIGHRVRRLEQNARVAKGKRLARR